MNEHENWIRYHCFRLARKQRRMGKVDEVIDDAKKIEAYVMGKKPADVISLVEKKDPQELA